MTGLWDLYSIATVLRFSRNSRMDKIECFVAGRKIASGLRWQDSVIHAHGDDFACPSDMFQTYMNQISPATDQQLLFVRSRVQKYQQCPSILPKPC